MCVCTCVYLFLNTIDVASIDRFSLYLVHKLFVGVAQNGKLITQYIKTTNISVKPILDRFLEVLNVP